MLFVQYSFAQCSVTSPSTTGSCSFGSSSLNLSATGSTGYYNWYSASTGGIPEFTGAIVNTPVLASTTTYYVSALDTSTALKLDGSNDYVALNYNFNGSGVISAFTAEAWVRTTYVGGGYSNNWAILDFDRSEYFNLYVRGDNGEVGFSTKGASTGIDDFYSTGNSVNDGQWHHIAAQFTGTDKVIYIDGSEVARKTGVHPNGIGSGTNRYGFIGDGSEASSFNANRNNIYYDGEVDEVRYWNVARTATEIHDWKDSVITTIPASLLLYYPMNEGTGTTVKNVAGPTGDGTMYNFNASTAWVKGSPVSYRCESARTPVTGTISSSSLQSGLLDCNVNSVSLDAGAGYSSYTWNTGATSRTITASEPGIYGVTVTGGACGGSRSVSVVGNTHSETSLNFDGNNDKGAIEGLSYEGTNYSALTVETWIKTSNPGNQIIASFDRSEYWRLEINGEGGAGNGKIGFDILTSTGQVDMGGTTNIADGKWHHIAAVFDNGNFTIYIDGIVDGTATGGSTFGTGDLRYGFLGVGSEASTYNGTTGPNDYFLGELDEFRIWEVARSETEIRDNMVQQMQTIEPGLVAYYKFDEPNGTIVYDYETDKPHNINLINFPATPRVTSGVPLGGVAQHLFTSSWGGQSIAVNSCDGENLTLDNLLGACEGAYIYYVNSVPNTKTGAVGVGANDRYFGVHKIRGSAATYTATYNYTGNPYVDAINESSLLLWTRSSNSQTWNSGSGTLDMNAKTVTVTAVSTEFALGSNSYPLPVELKYFELEKHENKTLIKWGTESEINNSSFTIERSNGNSDWIDFIKIDGAGNSNTLIEYSAWDEKPFIGNNFYRIKQTDYDGSESYSTIKSVNHNVTALGEVNIYPNPSSNLVTISNVNFDINQIKIISTNGVDFTNQLKLDGIQNNGNQISVDITSLKSGSYIIWIQDVSYLFIKE